MNMGFVMIEWKIDLLTVLCICFSSITVGCLGYTVYCEIGGEVCLDFVKNNSFDTFSIKKDSLLVCFSNDGFSTYVFPSFIDKVNCSISPTKMSM